MKNTSHLKHLLICLCLICFNIVSSAKPIDLHTAARIAKTFTKTECVSMDLSTHRTSPTLKIGESGEPEFYIFNHCDSTGFVIVSGDDNTAPVLGFGLSGAIDPENIPDNLKAHLENLRRDVITARNSTRNLVPAHAEKMSEKGMRLLTPNWNQSGYPYAALIPGQVHAGCVPAAMSIIMGAWHWPLRGEGESTHSGGFYRSDGEYIGYDITLNHDTPFNLENPTFEYDTESCTIEDEDVLARLLYHTSVAVESKYNPSGSGAYVYKARDAFADHFKFSRNMHLDYHQSHEEIAGILREEIASGRPVIYSANSESSGHAFVCDGVWDDYFHFNLGWGGSGNGYYLLTAIDAHGDSHGYNYDPYILYPLKPDDTRSDYTPRSIPVVYDTRPTSYEVSTSPNYSPVEFTDENGGIGLASPRDNYPRGQEVSIYASGMKLTGRFNDTTEDIKSMNDYSKLFQFAIGVVDAEGNMRAIYPTTSKSYISRLMAYGGSNTYTFKPDIDINPTDRLCLYTKSEDETEWKIIKGLPGTTDHLSGSMKSSEYEPFAIDINLSDFSLQNKYGQLENKIVKGQNYIFYIYPKRAMQSVEIKINGNHVHFTQSLRDDGTVKYCGVHHDFVTDDGISLSVRPLTIDETTVSVHLSEAGSLETKIGGNAGKIRHLTITGEVDARDLKFLSKRNFPMIETLDLSKSSIRSYLSIFNTNEIPQYFMYNHQSLRELHLPGSLTSIGEYTASWSWSLKKLSIPDRVTYIPKYALSELPLEEVTNYSKTPQTIYDYFVSNLADNSTLYVPVGCKTEYENHPLWSKFAHIIERELVGVENIKIDGAPLRIYRMNDNIVIEGLKSPVPVYIYSLTGQTVWTGRSDELGSARIPTSTLLIVNVGGKSFKLF